MENVTLPAYPGYAIRPDGCVVRLGDGTAVPQRTVVDLWVRGRTVQVELSWLHALAYGEIPPPPPVPAASTSGTDRENQLLRQENQELRAVLAASGIF